MQPWRSSASQVADRDAERRKNDDVVRAERGAIFAGIGEDADFLRAQPIVHVRVVDDFAGEKDAAIRKLLSRLIRVIHRAIDAVAKPEFSGEVQRETARAMDESRLAHLVDDAAMVGRGQFGLDGRFQVEALAKNNRRQRRP